MIGVIGDKDTVTGFSLAGVKKKVTAESRDETKNAFEEFMHMPDMKVIIITEKLAEDIREEIDRHRGTWPVVVEIPDKKGKMERTDPVERLIKKVTGVVPEVR